MEQVAKEAGVGKGTVYGYFAGKDDLFGEIICFSVEAYRRGLKENLDRGATIEEKLINCSRYNIEFLTRHMDMLDLATQVKVLSREMRRFLIEQQEAIFAHYRQVVEEAREKGELRQDLDAEMAAYLINGTIDQFAKQKVFCEAHPADQIDPRPLIEVILRGLRDEA